MNLRLSGPSAFAKATADRSGTLSHSVGERDGVKGSQVRGAMRAQCSGRTLPGEDCILWFQSALTADKLVRTKPGTKLNMDRCDGLLRCGAFTERRGVTSIHESAMARASRANGKGGAAG